MAFSSEIIKQADLQLDQRRTANLSRQRMLPDEIYDAVPELRTTDRQLRSGMLELTAVAFDHSADPEARCAEIRARNRALQDRRIEVLTAHGYEPDALEEKPLCPKCADLGWVGSSMCSCLRELCTQQQNRSLSSLLDLGDQSFENFSLEWYSPEFDEALGISPRENMAMVEKVCRNYACRFGKFVIHNLFLTGAPGLGKTFLSAAIARVVSKAGCSVVYDTAVNIFANFEAAKFGRSEAASEAVNRYLSCDLLILDDLGSELLSQMSQSSLYTIINSRLVSDKHTVISSNLDLPEIRTRYLPMIASRLEGEYRQLSFVGSDIRIQRKNRF